MNTVMANVYPGQRVIAHDGAVYTVAFMRGAQVYAYGRHGIPVAITVVCDAWGGEQEIADGSGDCAGSAQRTFAGAAPRGRHTLRTSLQKAA